MTNYTISEVIDAVAANVKSGKWISCTFPVSTDKGVFSIGVKAFGKWVQRVECVGMADGLSEQKTVKALRSELENLINRMIASV